MQNDQMKCLASGLKRKPWLNGLKLLTYKSLLDVVPRINHSKVPSLWIINLQEFMRLKFQLLCHSLSETVGPNNFVNFIDRLKWEM